MGKRVVDLTAEELGKAAGEAWDAAAQEALAKGLPITGSRDGRRYRYHPDGHIEDLGPVFSHPVIARTDADAVSWRARHNRSLNVVDAQRTLRFALVRAISNA